MKQVAKKIRIFLADDHPVLQEGIRLLLDMEPHMEVVGEAADGEEVLEKIGKQSVDILLLDIRMPEMTGLELIEHVVGKYPAIKVLVLSMYDDDQYIHHMIQQGAKGYILKTCRKDELIRAIETVHAGDSYLGKEVAEKLALSMSQKDQQGKNKKKIPLTKREIEIIKLVATGRTNHQIGKLLHISHRTVDTHRRNIMEKLNLHNAAALTNYAAKNGLLDLN